jgi:hypothetical protein
MDFDIEHDIYVKELVRLAGVSLDYADKCWYNLPHEHQIVPRTAAFITLKVIHESENSTNRTPLEECTIRNHATSETA